MSNPERILMTADTLGGVWTYALDLAGALEKSRVNVILATMGQPLSKEQKREADSLSNVEVHESAFKLEWMQDPWEDVERAGEWLLELERRTRPDLIHLNGFVHGSLPWSAPKMIVGHSCVCSWWSSVRGDPIPDVWRRYRDSAAKGLHSANLVAAPSAWMLKKLDEFYGLFSSKVVVRNGRDPSLFRAVPKENFVLAAGRLWDEAKNFALLEKTARELSCPLYVAGEKEHPDGGGVRFTALRLLGTLPPARLAGWYSRAGIFVSAALYEPFGLAPLEAGLSGCALVLSDIPSLREIWEDAALFVPPNDGRAFHSVLQGLLENPGQREQLGKAAYARAIQFTSEKMGEEYMKIYRGLLRDRSASLSPMRLPSAKGVCVKPLREVLA